MRTKIVALPFALLFVAMPSVAQTAPPASEKPETSCNSTSSAAPADKTKTADTSMAIEKSAILPSAGNYTNSAAPTVQSDGKSMEVRADCPPETKK